MVVCDVHPVSMLKMRPDGLAYKSAFLAIDSGPRLDPDRSDGHSGQLDAFSLQIRFSANPLRVVRRFPAPRSLDLHVHEGARTVIWTRGHGDGDPEGFLHEVARHWFGGGELRRAPVGKVL